MVSLLAYLTGKKLAVRPIKISTRQTTAMETPDVQVDAPKSRKTIDVIERPAAQPPQGTPIAAMPEPRTTGLRRRHQQFNDREARKPAPDRFRCLMSV